MQIVRRWWLASLTLVLGLAAATPALAVDAKLLPGDTEVVISVNIKQMLDSQVAKTYRDAIDQAKGFLAGKIQENPAAKYLEKAGFDLFRDLHSITVASNGSKDLDTGTIIITGSFKEEKVLAAAEDIARDAAEVLKISSVGSTKVFEITPPGEKRIYAALVNERTMIATGSLDGLKECISRSKTNSTKGLKEGFRSLLKTTNENQSFSFVATGTALGRLIENAPVPNADAAAGMLLGLDGISAAITLKKDIQFQLGINAKDAETAKQTVAAGNFGLLTVRTLAQNKAKENDQLQPLVEIAKTLRITSDGNNVMLRGEVSTENLERLIKVLPRGFNQ
jgi:hypothetical protein